MADMALAMGEWGGDIIVDGFDLARDDGLETAVIISLFCDSRAASAEQIPVELPKDDLRGYWGDVRPAVDGDNTGSLLWLLGREKQTPQTLARAHQYCREALSWMTDDKVASHVDVACSYVSMGLMLIEIDIFRPDSPPVTYRYNYEWSVQAAKRA